MCLLLHRFLAQFKVNTLLVPGQASLMSTSACGYLHVSMSLYVVVEVGGYDL